MPLEMVVCHRLSGSHAQHHVWVALCTPIVSQNSCMVDWGEMSWRRQPGGFLVRATKGREIRFSDYPSLENFC
ncbi:hypothetical protein Q31b_48330 [Novipirellula aureliae]|uniref:Uncharacterized protein n=1 Tax=Novipirellula aureliae TaxID=2527966 RepID=A0A5C6DIZ6_9BACT|nr:hypothetical protein Q31b_48330 [Novipirellula aureliae]